MLLRELRDVLETRRISILVVAVLDLRANVSQAIVGYSSCVCAHRHATRQQAD